MRRGVNIMFVLVGLAMVGALLWNVYMFRDCMSRGYAAFQCNAAINNPNYIAVDQMDPQ